MKPRQYFFKTLRETRLNRGGRSPGRSGQKIVGHGAGEEGSCLLYLSHKESRTKKNSSTSDTILNRAPTCHGIEESIDYKTGSLISVQ